jgi:hypothetical protein
MAAGFSVARPSINGKTPESAGQLVTSLNCSIGEVLVSGALAILFDEASAALSVYRA